MICLPTDGFDAIVSMTEGEPLLARSLLRHISSIALSMESSQFVGLRFKSCLQARGIDHPLLAPKPLNDAQTWGSWF
jgi:hypothetical protein